MTETILVTGGAGFIGSHIVDQLLIDGHNVVCIDDLSTGHKKNIEQHANNNNFHFYEMDLRNQEAVVDLIKKHNITKICHQGARGSVPKSMDDPMTTNSINVSGTLAIFCAAKETGVKRVVFASSSSVYGDTEELPKHEEMRLNPKSPYAVSKYTKELYGAVFSESMGVSVLGLRYFNVFGPRQDPNGAYAAVIPAFTAAAQNNQTVTINGDGSFSRDFTYVADVVQANIKALFSDAVGACNIGCNGNVTIQELAETIIEQCESTSEIKHQEVRAGDVAHSYASVDLAKKLIGYEPKYTFAQGLAETLAWYKEHL